MNRLILKIYHALRSAFRSTGDLGNATAVTLATSTVTRARHQDLPQFATLLTNKAVLVGGLLTAHNITSAELSTLAAAAAGGLTSGKSTGKHAGAKANRQAAENRKRQRILKAPDCFKPAAGGNHHCRAHKPRRPRARRARQ